jgi:hypothetical protein
MEKMDKEMLVLKFIFDHMWNDEMQSWWEANVSELMDILPAQLSTTDPALVTKLLRSYILKGLN